MRTVATYRVFIFWATVAHAFPASSATDGACDDIDLSCTSYEQLELGHCGNSTTLAAYPRGRVSVAGHLAESLHSAWEPTLPDLFYPCDLVAASSSAMTLQRPPSLSTPSNPGSLTPPACLTNLHEHPGSCPSAAPAKPPRHSSTSTSTSSASSRDRARLRRATSASIASAGCLHTHSSPGHTPELELWDVGDFVLDAGSSRTPLGVLYHSCSLWELVSLASAVAWLLVCLAA